MSKQIALDASRGEDLAANWIQFGAEMAQPVPG
jgi:hypothetical protein